jgi:hypothetical protein
MKTDDINWPMLIIGIACILFLFVISTAILLRLINILLY